MKNIDELNAIVDIVLANHLPLEHVLFMDAKQKRETDLFLKSLGGQSSTCRCVPSTGIQCDSITYAGVTFYIIDTGYLEKEPHLHEWAESKTFSK